MIKPLLLIPSYNTGPVLMETVKEALAATSVPVCVVVDGSTDQSEASLRGLAASEPRLCVVVKKINEGKGAAVRTGLEKSLGIGYTHVLVMDADGQHPAPDIDKFFDLAEENPEAMILGQPIFDENVPFERLYGRKLSVLMVQFEVMSRAIGDPLYGFRVYPIAPLLEVMAKPGRSNRYDFDPEVAVRLNWRGVPAVKVGAPVKYIEKEQGGISHFHYLRDNLRFIALHVKLVIESPYRWISKLFRKNSQAA